MCIHFKLFPLLASLIAMFSELHRRSLIYKIMHGHSILTDLACLNNNIVFDFSVTTVIAVVLDSFQIKAQCIKIA